MGVVYVEVDDDDGDSEYDRVGGNTPSSLWTKNKKKKTRVPTLER